MTEGVFDIKVRVRRSGSYQTVDISEFDDVPCRMRISMPGKSRLNNPVPGRPDGVSPNTDILVWCECMAQTWDQLQTARYVREHGMDPRLIDWPEPKQQRGWDVLGAVSTVLIGTNSAASNRGRRSNPNVTEETRAMYSLHLMEREWAVSSRRRNQPTIDLREAQ